jgi:hypothetical protein
LFSFSGNIMIIKFIRFQVPNYQCTHAPSWSNDLYPIFNRVETYVWMLVWNLFCSNPRWTDPVPIPCTTKRRTYIFQILKRKYNRDLPSWTRILKEVPVTGHPPCPVSVMLPRPH